MNPPVPGSIVFHETGGYDWSERALVLLRDASRGGSRGDAAAALRALLVEPSGLVEQLLQRLGTSPDALRAQLDAAEPQADPRVRKHPAGTPSPAYRTSRRAEGFAPASASQVWALLSDPLRLPEWDPAVGAMRTAESAGIWEAFAHTRRADGSALRVRPRYRRMRVERGQWQEGLCATWRFAYPDAPRANTRSVRVELEPAAGGTQLTITVAWEPCDGALPPAPIVTLAVRRLTRLAMRPLTRVALWLQTSHLSASISRVFR